MDASDGYRAAAFRSEVTRQILRRERLAFATKVEQCPQETLRGMAVDLDRVLHLPFLVTEANEDEVVAVKPDAEQRIERLTVLGPHVVKAFLDLLDDFLAARRVRLRSDPVACALRIFVFDNDAGIDRIHAGPAIFVGGWAVGQLWLFWVAPIVGGMIGGLIYRLLAEEGQSAAAG
jgi:hypothetical protein